MAAETNVPNENYVIGLDWINKRHGWACARIDLLNPRKIKFSVVSLESCEGSQIKNAGKIVLDAPIGLENASPAGCKLRPCDEGARQWVGANLQSTVFAVPFEGELGTWRIRKNQGEKQKLGHFRGLLPAIDSADEIRKRNKNTLESHPEVVFCSMVGHSFQDYASKKTLLGQMLRVAILKQMGLELPLEDLVEFGRIGTDNFIDAVAMVYVAMSWMQSESLSVIRTADGTPQSLKDGSSKELLIALPRDAKDCRRTPELAPEETVEIIENWRKGI